MTKAEYLIMRSDEQTRQAIECFQHGDILGAGMHRNIANGFQEKLEKLTAEECREEIK